MITENDSVTYQLCISYTIEDTAHSVFHVFYLLVKEETEHFISDEQC